MARVATPAASHTSAVVTQSRAFGSLTGSECSWTGRNQTLIVNSRKSAVDYKKLSKVHYHGRNHPCQKTTGMPSAVVSDQAVERQPPDDQPAEHVQDPTSARSRCSTCHLWSSGPTCGGFASCGRRSSRPSVARSSSSFIPLERPKGCIPKSTCRRDHRSCWSCRAARIVMA